MEESQEVKVIFKTQSQHFAPICKYIVEKGSYEVPEVVQVDVLQGNPSYVAWVIAETTTAS